MDNYQKVSELIFKHLRQDLTTEEAAELESWRRRSDENQRFFDNINNIPELMNDVRVYATSKENQDKAWAKLLTRFPEVQSKFDPPVRQMTWLRYAVAAAIILVVGSLTFYLYRNTIKPANVPLVVHTHQSDAKPIPNHAYLTLDNGETITLDSAKGVLARQGSAKVEKKSDGTLNYTADAKSTNDKLLYNKITVPKGSDVVYLQLSDQTKVWLNSESSIRYPVTFTGEKRSVEITGEAFFDVTHNAKRPFVVQVKGMQIQVLGTEFNVKAYQEDNVFTTTLLKGKVQLTGDKDNQVLSPGQQVDLFPTGDMKLVEDADIDKAVGWKSGIFVFKGDDVHYVMNQLSRTYDVNVVYKGEVKDKFYGIINRKLPVQEVLEMMQKSTVHFQVTGQTITVTP